MRKRHAGVILEVWLTAAVMCYCQLCLETQIALGDKGHIAKVTNFASTTSSGNMNLHLSQRNNILTNSEKCRSMMEYVKKYSDSSAYGNISNKSDCDTRYRDLVLQGIASIWECRERWVCRLLQGECPSLHIPAPVTLGGTALEDTYQAVRSLLKTKMANVKSLCLMFGGWTDRYKARSYLGVRASFVQDDWLYSVVTLRCNVLTSHAACDVADHISHVLKNFFSDVWYGIVGFNVPLDTL